MRAMNTLKNRRFLILLALGALLAVLFTQAVTQNSPAPQVTFTSLKGEKIPMRSLRGKVVLVNFWATSCVGCVHEMPQMVDTYRKFQAQGLETIAVAMSYDPPNYVVNYTEKNALPFKVALDVQGDIAQAFGDVKLTPTTFVIDKRGNIIKRILGEPDFAKLHLLLEKELQTA
ncbi:MAG TPA: TlpA disulfide reductase family protein [Burkholderiales bacterium]|nr:TlpA disulfide reductase family protein [Burkholderiales bacterium]